MSRNQVQLRASRIAARTERAILAALGFIGQIAAAAATVLVLAYVHDLMPALAAVSVILLCCGGGFGTMPCFNARCFGTKFMGLNCGLILPAWGFAGLIGPILIAHGKDLTGSFAGILPLIAFVLSASVILPYLTKKPLAQAGEVGRSRELVPTSAGATVAALSSSCNLWSLRAAIRGLAAMVLVALTAGFGSCSGGGGPMYVLQGSVSGLLPGHSVVLQNYGSDSTVVSANGSFNFTRPFSGGAPYSVTVLTQPSSETCATANGSGTGTVGPGVSVDVVCAVADYVLNLRIIGLGAATLVLKVNNNAVTVQDIGGAPTVQLSLNLNRPIGTPYAVTVATQPLGEDCTVTNGSGTAATSAVNVAINCVASYTIGGAVSGLSAGSNVVLKDNGSNATTVSANGSFTFSTALANQSPYAVTVSTQPTGQSCSVANGSGTVPGVNVTNVAVACTSTANAGLWTWESGSNTPEYIGVYGTQGTAAPGNVPGSREAALSWTDGAGNLWMFGGIGTGNSGVGGSFNDLWRYSPSTGLWAWMGGADTLDALSVYGSKGTAAAGNVPSAREGGSAWTDSAGDFWLFGGGGFDSTGSNGALNDLWRYSPSTGLWAWMSGPTTGNSGGAYGTLGAAAPSNVPGARSGEVSWKDSAGNFWLFGGGGSDSTDLSGYLNDLWRYSPGSGLWTWMGGSTGTNAPGVYGTLGTAASDNIPGARFGAVAWTDGSGNFWLFGGHGYDSTGTVGSLNDLWRYSPNTGQWTWMNGSETQGAAGVYGTLGTAAAGDVPGAREDAASWIDNAGNLWLFGDGVFDSNGNLLSVGNDLWRYAPSTGLWTWMGGSTVQGAPGVYGALGIAAAGNVPGGRDIGVPFIDGAGNFWLFGGYVPAGALNDLWKYVPPGP